MCNAVIHFRVLKKKGRLIDGDGSEGAPEGGERWRAHGKCCDSDTSSMQRVAGIKKKATYSDVHWIFHSRLSFCVLTDFHIVTNSVCACAASVYVCVCVCVNFYFSCHSLYLLFVGVFCSVCIIGESLIFLLS